MQHSQRELEMARFTYDSGKGVDVAQNISSMRRLKSGLWPSNSAGPRRD